MQQLTPIEARKKRLKILKWTIATLCIVLVAIIITIISYI
ncbi:hypothetical protein SAMN05216497_1352 [Clostridium cochlearium]|uniref:Uncharacterized protein n=1 Tax=Clostridium cochlearium TaxID=1494 RepID=A0ABY0QPE3_CLOCO|nr:hypothetical protein SAMN05216497_1352 [Clostridium cochlearium]SNV68228.1 Uncharacterised protein [Clostridium cochlearium]STA91691.1 Uncharacterised protein [Clostridium cochlearium]